MKQLLLFLFLLTATLQAQQAILPASSSATDRQATKAAISPITAPALGTFDKSAVADTLFPAILSEPCGQSAQLFFSDTSGTLGFLSGTNQFLDVEKIQRVELAEATNFTVEQVVVAFAIADEELADRKVAVNVYTDLAPDGSFGEYVGTSDTLLVSDLVTNDTFLLFTTFPFSTPAAFTDESSFLIGVNFLDTYFNEQDSLDRSGDVAIFSTDLNCGDGQNALEIFPTQTGLSFETIRENWGLDIEFFIGAIIERDPFTSTRTPNTDFAANAFPNPANEGLSISFTAPASGEYVTRLLAPTGQEVRTKQIFASQGTNTVPFAVADLSAGVYLFQVEHATGIQTGRVVIK